MERLTFDGNFCDISQCRETPCRHGGNCSQRQVWERLKQYEDVGISPNACEEVRKIEEGLNSGGYSIARMVDLMIADKAGHVAIQRWIPAAEQLPEDGQDVLCWYEYYRYGDYNAMYATYGIGYQYNGNWGGEVSNGTTARVLAWMPLPEPPEGC